MGEWEYTEYKSTMKKMFLNVLNDNVSWVTSFQEQDLIGPDYSTKLFKCVVEVNVWTYLMMVY